MEKIRFLECLSKQYPTIDSAATEIINLQSILNLPKGTEHFLSDIHGEYKAFAHVLRNGSGAVMKKIDDVFGDTLFEDQKEDLASLIYYPSEKLQYVKIRAEPTAVGIVQRCTDLCLCVRLYLQNTHAQRSEKLCLKISDMLLRSLLPRKKKFSIKRLIMMKL